MRSTAARTPDGRSRSKMNATSHGQRSAVDIAKLREFADAVRVIRLAFGWFQQ